nr:dynein light chain 1, cytoplasmic [Ipomoea trifida]GLL39818.1 dynein light chain 1, cytoplasmic [Ipomoea trifida]GLL39820.1 dynein light chain 1, cytoplasmic [Ipomoea trifida]GLL39822.1 dynein light chain 1, cytoplasmic [Ipomoea trifida]
MSEDSKRNDGGALVAKPSAADDRKYASPPTSSITVSKKVIIKSADMKKEAVDIAIAAFEKNSVEKDVAEHIKKEFDKKHGPIYPTAMAAELGSTTQT